MSRFIKIFLIVLFAVSGISSVVVMAKLMLNVADPREKIEHQQQMKQAQAVRQEISPETIQPDKAQPSEPSAEN
ncbi:hypothetical protein VA7868_04428 [Vibrio aerogenes CECT 7868]|uniref:Uncharacterized protein n=1 Tax=Vibrio aerogenes CECT 7868 TaxID=1216006 RepID=A0A1M6ECF6_9VIBR|nr:hypothetical protein [Vibrio aerogenes]SHI83187.1 hypothetical protein VA7868_04428 [Vibrio aerogenes CECT 7868]